MPNKQLAGIPLCRRNKQPDRRYGEKHMITASGQCDRRGTRTRNAGVLKRAELLFARSAPQQE